jgi:hypothetical protein
VRNAARSSCPLPPMPSLTKNPGAAVDKHPSVCLKFPNTTFKVTEKQQNK